MSTVDDQTKFLHIYLEDHLAGATAGSQRAVRLADAESASKDGAALAAFARDVAADVDALTAVIEALGVEPSRVKAVLASVAEKVGALKLNGRILERSPLSTVVELEAMQMAVRGKRSLWETLQTVLTQPTPVDLEALIARADGQLDLLVGLHAERVVDTFAPRSS